MVVRDSTVPFHPVPKTRVIYESLKAFEQIDLDGNFIEVDFWDTLKQLKNKGIVSASYDAYYRRLVTLLAEKGVLKHHNGFKYSYRMTVI